MTIKSDIKWTFLISLISFFFCLRLQDKANGKQSTANGYDKFLTKLEYLDTAMYPYTRVEKMGISDQASHLILIASINKSPIKPQAPCPCLYLVSPNLQWTCPRQGTPFLLEQQLESYTSQ